MANQYFDIYGAPVAGSVERYDTMSQATKTTGGANTGIVRINYDNTMGPARILQAIRAIRRWMEAEGNQRGYFSQ